MKFLLVSYIFSSLLGIEAFQDLKGCSVYGQRGICMIESDCFAAYSKSKACDDQVCCQNTGISFRKCLNYKTKPSMLKYRIIGGITAQSNEFPFMVAIGKEPEEDSPEEQKWFCGGSIISENFIITAAHCIKKQYVRSYVILAGTTSLNSSEAQLRQAAEVIIHPKFIPWKMGYDLALIRVRRPFRFSSNVFPICLLGPSILPSIFKGQAIGFGVEKEGVTERIGSLMKVTLDVFSSKECDRFYPAIVQYGGYKPSVLCAGVENGGKDTCQGDSGGPLIIPIMKPVPQYGLFGVTSAGLSCGLSRSPGIYIKVPYFLSWIERNVWREELKGGI